MLVILWQLFFFPNTKNPQDITGNPTDTKIYIPTNIFHLNPPFVTVDAKKRKTNYQNDNLSPFIL